MISVFKLQQ